MLARLWTSAVALLLVDARTRADTQPAHDSATRNCFECLPTAGDSRCPVTPLRMLCGHGKTFCATTTSTPDLNPKLICMEELQQPCSLTFSKKTQSYNITCYCGHSYCNSHFSDLLAKNLRKFAAVNTKTEGELFRNFLEFANLSHVTDDKITQILLNESQIENWNANKPFINSEVESIDAGAPSAKAKSSQQELMKKRAESLPKPDALKNEATVPSDDDEDEGEGSGASEEPRAPRRPAAAPAAPSSFLPANASNKNFITSFFHLIFTPFFIYIIT